MIFYLCKIYGHKLLWNSKKSNEWKWKTLKKVYFVTDFFQTEESHYQNHWDGFQMSFPGVDFIGISYTKRMTFIDLLDTI